MALSSSPFRLGAALISLLAFLCPQQFQSSAFTSSSSSPAFAQRAFHDDAPTVVSSTFSRLYAEATAKESAETESESDSSSAVDFGTVGFVLLAGGTGSRMKANMPKQFLELKGSPVLYHSLNLFLETLPKFAKEQGLNGPPMVVLVMDPLYQPDYQPIVDKYSDRLAFANPGVERQGSVQNGVTKLQSLSLSSTSTFSCTHVAIHDSARPLVTIDEISNVVRDAQTHGAAVLGVPCKATIKESEDGSTVLRTIPRARLWEVHTPQVIELDLLCRGFQKVEEDDLEVTDDVSIIEAMGETVKLTLGEYTNLKITTPEDMDVAGAILDDRGDIAKISLLD